MISAGPVSSQAGVFLSAIPPFARRPPQTTVTFVRRLSFRYSPLRMRTSQCPRRESAPHLVRKCGTQSYLYPSHAQIQHWCLLESPDECKFPRQSAATSRPKHAKFAAVDKSDKMGIANRHIRSRDGSSVFKHNRVRLQLSERPSPWKSNIAEHCARRMRQRRNPAWVRIENSLASSSCARIGGHATRAIAGDFSLRAIGIEESNGISAIVAQA